MLSASVVAHLMCPSCGVYELEAIAGGGTRCYGCGSMLGAQMLRTLEEIGSLPGALGLHACECGHPYMRRLPDGVFHCPSCGAEVTPVECSDAGSAKHGGVLVPFSPET